MALSFRHRRLFDRLAGDSNLLRHVCPRLTSACAGGGAPALEESANLGSEIVVFFILLAVFCTDAQLFGRLDSCSLVYFSAPQRSCVLDKAQSTLSDFGQRAN